MRRTFAGVLLLASAMGCSSSSGGPQGSPDASTDSASTTFGGSTCGQCVTTACATAIAACGAAPDCQAYLTCLDGCAVGGDGNVDPACESACPQATSSSGQQAESQLTACRTTGAGASCVACGGSSDASAEGGVLHETCAPDLDAANGCAKCIREQCCDVRLACLNDPQCLDLLNCWSDCRSGLPDEGGASAQPPDGGVYSCDQWCNAKGNPSLRLWAQYLTCGEILCQEASQCGPGDACLACGNQNCATELLALNGTPDGYLFDDCIAQCATTDTTCQMQCQSTYPSVTSAFSAYVTCITQHCPGCAN